MVQVISPYGVAIDTHSKFIQVCVLCQHAEPGDKVTVRQREKEFSTHWHDLTAAKRWVLGILGPKADPDTSRYCIESRPITCPSSKPPSLPSSIPSWLALPAARPTCLRPAPLPTTASPAFGNPLHPLLKPLPPRVSSF